MDNIESLSILYFGRESQKQFAKAVREIFEPEWGVVAFPSYDVAADKLDIAILFIIGNEEMRADVTFDADYVEATGWTGVLEQVNAALETEIYD